MFMANKNLVHSLRNKNNGFHMVHECEIDVELNK